MFMQQVEWKRGVYKHFVSLEEAKCFLFMVPKERQADMNSREYLTEVLRYYRSSFDVSLPYSLGGRDYEALAEFHASTEKYILVRQFRLWSENTDEFVLFSLFEGGAPTLEDISALQASIREHMEPLFVRGGKEKLHDENHMYTYLTMALYCDTMPEENVIRAVKKTRFKKYYEHGISGYSEGSHISALCGKWPLLDKSRWAGNKTVI